MSKLLVELKSYFSAFCIWVTAIFALIAVARIYPKEFAVCGQTEIIAL